MSNGIPDGRLTLEPDDGGDDWAQHVVEMLEDSMFIEVEEQPDTNHRHRDAYILHEVEPDEEQW